MSDQQPIKRILYATNLGEHMRPVFQYAVNLARIHKAKIIMLHAVAPLGTTSQTVLSLYLPDKKVKEIEHENMEDVIQQMKLRLESYCSDKEDICTDQDDLIEDLVVTLGKPARVINRYAIKHDADLIVIGSHTRHSKTGLLGSTARHVTQHSEVPVLVVPNSVK